jgi:hypothetical protein
MHSTEIIDDDKRLIAAVDYYFIQASEVIKLFFGTKV